MAMASVHEQLAAALLAGKKPRAFDRPWLDVATLPPLRGDDGRALSLAALHHVLTCQQKHKPIEAAEAVAPWLQMLAPDSAREFALAMLHRWLASEHDAKDRFAMTFAGLFGDDSVIALLNERIQGWCDGSRHKLAEYAVDAIALLASDAALMALDTVRTRYRSKFRNVGAAAERAFLQAAAVRGISADELGDLVMPTLGFDAHGRRTFTWPSGAIDVELGIDWKLAYHGTAIGEQEDKQWRALPSFVPAEVAAAIKQLQKDVREASKGQIRRLEMGLVRQRRWSAPRFRELFLDHALGRTFASRLVFGVYDQAGQLLRCCRRYANGILADAHGALDELAEVDLQVGFVHPLELSAAARHQWCAHLERNKVKQPFAQMDRPVVRLDTQHKNHRELVLTEGRGLSAGTFRSRAERLGWQRGSVVDAGGVPNYWKDFVGCGIEVMLDLEGFYIGIDPMSPVELGRARFVRADSVARGSYVYDDPGAEDDRIVRFGDVPEVVYSETVADLMAIVGEAL